MIFKYLAVIQNKFEKFIPEMIISTNHVFNYQVMQGINEKIVNTSITVKFCPHWMIMQKEHFDR